MHNGKSPPQSTWSMFTKPNGTMLITQRCVVATGYVGVCTSPYVSTCDCVCKSMAQWAKCSVVNGQWYNTLKHDSHWPLFLFPLQGDSEEFSSFITLVWGSNRKSLFQTGKILPPWNCIIEQSTPSMTITCDQILFSMFKCQSSHEKKSTGQ